MTTINPYLTFLGNCEEAFNFYKSVFGGEFLSFNRFSEMPPQEGVSLPEDYQDKIMHIALPISGDFVLMGSDSGGDWASNTVVGNNIALSINADSKEDADRFFNLLSTGGKVTMAMSETFWGEYYGMCTDPFAINWMISFRESEKS